LGVSVDLRDESREDLVLHWKGKVAVAEVKGYSGSARERDAIQLNKWVSIYHDAHGIEPKGVLIVNAFRERPLRERDAAFPNQMLAYSNKREFSLVTTLQLFLAELAADEDPKAVEEFVGQLFSEVGVVASFTDWSALDS
jgi:hypothetical protein